MKCPLADPRGAPGTRAPPGPNSFIFMQFSAKIWKVIAILRVGAPPWGKSWIRHWNASYVTVTVYSDSASTISLMLLDTSEHCVPWNRVVVTTTNLVVHIQRICNIHWHLVLFGCVDLDGYIHHYIVVCKIKWNAVLPSTNHITAIELN